MKKIMKICGVMVSIMLAGSVCMAEPHGGYDHHGYYDGGRHYGYYRDSRGELVFGLLGLGVLAAVVASSADRPVYVQQPVVVRESPQVVYVQQPTPQPQVVYVQPPQVQQPIVVQQTAQYEPPQPMTVTVSIQNSNGSFTPITLRQVGAQWVGPKGEYYNAVPSVGQLRPVYGF